MYDYDQDNLVNGGCFWLVIFALIGAIVIVTKIITNIWNGE